MNGLPVRQTAIIPITRSRARSGAAMRRSFSSVVGDAGDRNGPRVAVRVEDGLGGAAGGEVADDALAYGDRVGEDGVGVPSERDRRAERLAALVGEVDGARLGLEESQRTLADPPKHRVEVEHRRDLASQFGQRRRLVRTPPCLEVEPGVLDRYADVGCDRRQQPGVRLVEPSFLLDALHADDADRLLAGHDRHAKVGPGERPDDRDPLVVLPPVEEERLP